MEKIKLVFFIFSDLSDLSDLGTAFRWKKLLPLLLNYLTNYLHCNDATLQTPAEGGDVKNFASVAMLFIGRNVQENNCWQLQVAGKNESCDSTNSHVQNE